MLTGAWLGFLDSGSNETDETAPGDDHGRLVDADGKNVFGCAYRAERLTRAGTTGARAVKCIRRIRTSKRFGQSSALKRRKSTELTGPQTGQSWGRMIPSVSATHRSRR